MVNSVNGSRATHEPSTPAPFPQLPTTGVMLLSASRTVVYITPAAQVLLQLIHEAEPKKQHQGSDLPTVVKRLVDDIQLKLTHCKSQGEWTKIHVQEAVQTVNHAITIRGLVLPDIDPDRPSRMLLLLETRPSTPQLAHDELSSDCQLTARQHSIVRGLMRGLTNKELANELQISAHTVKEYVRVIMGKVHATSRTGVVARLSSVITQATPALSVERSRPGRHGSQRRWL